MVKKLLIIGASILQKPAIIKAKELGFYVGVVDYNPNAIGVAYADEYFCVSTIDVDGIVDVAKKFKPKGIMTLATDMPMRAIAKACEECNLSGISYKTAIITTDKGEMIKAFKAHDVDHPWFYIVSNKQDFCEIKDKIIFPCIIKPTDNSGSRGVILCNNYEELEKSYEYARHESRSGEVIIEEYLEGPEFSVEVIVIGGVPHVIQVTDKVTTGPPYFVEMGHSQPTTQPCHKKEMIEKLAIKACKAVGINTGPAHVEIILTKDGPKMVELGARMGGDYITSHLVPLSTGIDMVSCVIKIACGEEIDIKPTINKSAAIRYIKTKKGVISSISGLQTAKTMEGISEVSIIHKVGDRMENDIHNSTERVGFVVAYADSVSNAIERCNKAIKMIRIEYKDI